MSPSSYKQSVFLFKLETNPKLHFLDSAETMSNRSLRRSNVGLSVNAMGIASPSRSSSSKQLGKQQRSKGLPLTQASKSRSAQMRSSLKGHQTFYSHNNPARDAPPPPAKSGVEGDYIGVLQEQVSFCVGYSSLLNLFCV